MSEFVIKSQMYNRFQCPNCNNKKIHCIAAEKKGEPVVMAKDRCNDKDCECKCRRFYIANNGKPRRYGTIDDTSAMDDFRVDGKRTETDDIIEKLNEQSRKLNESKQGRTIQSS